MYENQQGCSTPLAPQEQPQLSYLTDKIGYEISEIFALKNQLTRKLHSLKDTNIPTPSSDEKQCIDNDLVSVLDRHVKSLSSLKEDFYQLNEKFNSLI